MTSRDHEAGLRSPIKDPSLPQAGDSIQRKIDDVINDDFLSYVVGATVMCAFAGLEWYRWLVPQKPSPWLFTLLALIGITVTTFQFFKVKKKVRLLRQGREGERAVGQYLERLREDGAKVFHDIPGKNFNIDHVVIHPAGVFVLETKTYSKPATGKPRIVFDGHAVSMLGRPADPKPIDQARANAQWIRNLLRETTGRDFITHPVVLFPGWFVENGFGGGRSDVWVLEPKALKTTLEQQPCVLATPDVNLAAFHLSRYCRAAAGDTRPK